MLALAFLWLIGTALVAEGLEFTIPKGYVYFAMGCLVFVEFLNLRARRRRRPRQPIELRPTFVKEREASGAVGHLPAGGADA